MDAIITFCLGLFFALKVQKEKPDAPKLEVRRNPNFIKDEQAFTKLYKAIMKEK